MSAAPFVTAGATSTTDPRALVVHLEVCRLQAEMERLEGRLAQVRSEASNPRARTAGSSLDPDVARTDELVDRMVATLLESGRVEIAEEAARRYRCAEGALDADRAMAAAIVEAARLELERALAERGRSLRAGWDEGLDLIVLAELEDDAHRSSTPTATDMALFAPDDDLPAVAVVVAAAAVELGPYATSEPAMPRAAAVEEARTDAAFEAWMAVAPEVSDATEPDAAPAVGAIDTTPAEPAARSRSRWLVPLEVTAALLVTALVVVLVLVFIG